jgi:hypothetical protein
MHTLLSAIQVHPQFSMSVMTVNVILLCLAYG